MADTPHFFYKFSQIRVTELLATGADDPSATAQNSTIPKDMTISFIYNDGEEAEQTGGGETVCRITEEDEPKGADIELTVASLEYDLKAAIAGGTVKTSGDDSTGWEFPTTVPGPFKFEAWIPAYDTSSSVEGMVDGYIKITCPFCVGRVSDRDHGETKWGEDKFSIKARQNPYSGDTAYEEEEVAAIT